MCDFLHLLTYAATSFVVLHRVCAKLSYFLAESLVNELFLMIQPDLHPIIRKQAFRYLYLISKVRGAKIMVRWFPHDVKDFEPVLVALQQQDPHDCEVRLPLI